ncbi:MAG: hypothetical protein OEY44_04460 [Candidatus Peregrinibacteria bacterium]|nr:hypothetical protein [Candidatus Peregrinibacteria bacterium]
MTTRSRIGLSTANIMTSRRGTPLKITTTIIDEIEDLGMGLPVKFIVREIRPNVVEALVGNGLSHRLLARRRSVTPETIIGGGNLEIHHTLKKVVNSGDSGDFGGVDIEIYDKVRQAVLEKL